MTAAGREDGVAMLIAMMAMLLMTALGTALMLTSSSETIIAAHFETASRRAMPPARCSSAGWTMSGTVRTGIR